MPGTSPRAPAYQFRRVPGAGQARGGGTRAATGCRRSTIPAHASAAARSDAVARGYPRQDLCGSTGHTSRREQAADRRTACLIRGAACQTARSRCGRRRRGFPRSPCARPGHLCAKPGCLRCRPSRRGRAWRRCRGTGPCRACRRVARTTGHTTRTITHSPKATLKPCSTGRAFPPGSSTSKSGTCMTLAEVWVTGDVRGGRTNDRWLNAIQAGTPVGRIDQT